MKFFLSFSVFILLSIVQLNQQEVALDTISNAIAEQKTIVPDAQIVNVNSEKISEISIQQPQKESISDLPEASISLNSEAPVVPQENSNQIWNIKNLLISGLAFSLLGYYLYDRKKAVGFNDEKNKLFHQLVDSREKIETLKLENQDLKTQVKNLVENQAIEPSNVLEQKIVLPGKQKTILKIGDILCVQSQKNAISIVTNKEPIWVWETLMNFTSTLPESEFCRAHRSYLVNLNEVVSYSKKSVILSNDQEVKIGQVYSAELLAKLKSRASNS